jgi:hypothetical protein
MGKMPAKSACPAPQTVGLTSARLVLDAGENLADISARLGVDLAQLAWGGDGALQVDLDLPPGSWRVYPPLHVALWISLRPGVDPPPIRHHGRLGLAKLVRRLRARGVRFRDLRVNDGETWSQPLRAAEALSVLKASDPCCISAMWSRADRHPARIEVCDDGTLWASTPADAAWWTMEALADD